MKKTLCLLLLTTLLVACEEENPNNIDSGYTTNSIPDADTNAVLAMPSDSIFYESKSFDKQSNNCQSDTANCAKFVAAFPLVEPRLHGKVSDSINNFIRQKLYAPLYGDAKANGLNSLLEPYYSAYKSALKEAQSEGQDYIPVWYYQRHFDVFHNTYWLFTIRHHEKSYAGGAHPNSFTNYYNFNPVTGRRLYVRNVFKAGYANKLKKIAEKKFRSAAGIAASASLEDEGFWFDNNEFALNENFYLDAGGIHFFYNAYEVAPADKGSITINIKYSEVQGMLEDIFDPENRLAFDKNHPQVGRY